MKKVLKISGLFFASVATLFILLFLYSAYLRNYEISTIAGCYSSDEVSDINHIALYSKLCFDDNGTYQQIYIDKDNAATTYNQSTWTRIEYGDISDKATAIALKDAAIDNGDAGDESGYYTIDRNIHLEKLIHGRIIFEFGGAAQERIYRQIN